MCRPVAWVKADSCASGSRTNSTSEAEDAVEEDERADELARLVARLGFPEHYPQNREQHQAFEPRFIQLARVARLAEHRHAADDLGEAHRPRHIGLRAPQFGVHEIGEAAEEQAERHAAGDIIVEPEPLQPFLRAR